MTKLERGGGDDVKIDEENLSFIYKRIEKENVDLLCVSLLKVKD